MPLRYNDPVTVKDILLAEQGQITVFLSLMFLILMGISFCMIEGVREYETSALTEEALQGAGREVLANYDRSLFIRYHLFFLDPREKEYMEEDGRQYLSDYFDDSAFYGFSCDSLKVRDCIYATFKDGILLKHEIREWMKYRKGTEEKTDLKNMEKALAAAEKRSAGYISEILSASNAPPERTKGEDRDLFADYEEEEDLYEEEVSKEAIVWKSMKESLERISGEGMTACVLGSGKGLSGLIADGTGRPSAGRTGLASGKGQDVVPEYTFSDVHRLAGYFPAEDVTKLEEGLLDRESCLLDYINLHFASFLTAADGGSKAALSSLDPEKKALSYEKEYLINGDLSDADNLKKVEKRIFLIRFLLNYDYVRNQDSLYEEAGRIAEGASGSLECNVNEEAGRLLLLGGLAYGQSLLDLSSMLSGNKVPLKPGKGTFCLDFDNFSETMSRRHLRDAGRGADYGDYLDLLLATRSMQPVLLLRMMDMMQMNVRLDEKDFLMEESLFSCSFEARFQSAGWFRTIPIFGVRTDRFLELDYSRGSSY